MVKCHTPGKCASFELIGTLSEPRSLGGASCLLLRTCAWREQTVASQDHNEIIRVQCASVNNEWRQLDRWWNPPRPHPAEVGTRSPVSQRILFRGINSAVFIFLGWNPLAQWLDAMTFNSWMRSKTTVIVRTSVLLITGCPILLLMSLTCSQWESAVQGKITWRKVCDYRQRGRGARGE